MDFLGMIVLRRGLEMCCDKVQTIQEWSIPNSVKEVQAFFGFTNFYQRFIGDYLKVAMPLIALIRKNQYFVWTPQTYFVSNDLKSKFIKASILLHPNFEHPFVVKTDVFNMAQLNWRQAQWSKFMSAFNFEIQHQLGSLDGRAHVLSIQIDLMEGQSQEEQHLLRLAMLESCQLV